MGDAPFFKELPPLSPMTNGDTRMTTGTFLARGVSSLVVRAIENQPLADGDTPFLKELPPLSH